MFCRSISWFIFIFVAVVIAANYSEPDSSPEATTEPVQDVKESTAKDLGELLDAGDGAVVTLVAGDTRLVVHRAVLAARSPVLASMLRDDRPEATGDQIEIPDLEGPVLRQLLAHLYTLQALQLSSMAPQLLAAADKYGLSALKEACEQQVAAQLTAETATATAVLAIRKSYTILRDATIAFIRTRIFHVMGTQGWADLVHSQPSELAEVSRLLSEAATETSSPAPGDSEAIPTTEPYSVHSEQSRIPASAASSTSTGHTHPPEDPAVSRLRRLSAEEKNKRLIEAAKEGTVEEVRLLLAAGADAGAADPWRDTALHFAARNGHVVVAWRLLAAGAEVDARNLWQTTPLQSAASSGHAAAVGLLLAASADVNARDENGRTALHWAAGHGHVEAAAVLLQAGADRQAADEWGDLPQESARRNNHKQLVDMLK